MSLLLKKVNVESVKVNLNLKYICSRQYYFSNNKQIGKIQLHWFLRKGGKLYTVYSPFFKSTYPLLEESVCYLFSSATLIECDKFMYVSDFYNVKLIGPGLTKIAGYDKIISQIEPLTDARIFNELVS